MNLLKCMGVAMMLLPNTICDSRELIEEKPIDSPKIITNPSNLIQALIHIESSNNDSCIGDKHMKLPSIGCLQIRPIMVCEVNRILKIQQNSKRFKNKDRWSRVKSIEMFNVWKNYHHQTSSNEVIARCWNGGPKGYKNQSTLRYWSKVKKYLKLKLGN